MDENGKVSPHLGSSPLNPSIFLGINKNELFLRDTLQTLAQEGFCFSGEPSIAVQCSAVLSGVMPVCI
jgi:hypothetical protein